MEHTTWTEGHEWLSPPYPSNPEPISHLNCHLNEQSHAPNFSTEDHSAHAEHVFDPSKDRSTSYLSHSRPAKHKRNYHTPDSLDEVTHDWDSTTLDLTQGASWTFQLHEWRPHSSTPYPTVGATAPSSQRESASDAGTGQLNSPDVLPDAWVCCGHDFTNQSAFRTHQGTRHNKRHHCNQSRCSKSFTEARSLKRHIRTCHSSARTIPCPQPGCKFAGFGFNRKDSLLKHYRRMHASGARMNN